MLVNRICGSGLISMIVGAQSIMTGYRNTVLCGGFESMSRAPHSVYMRKGMTGHAKLNDELIEGLTDAASGDIMGLCTERVAKRLNITREEMDNIAILSYENSIKAKKDKHLEKEIVEVPIKGGVSKEDEEILKFDKEKMKKLKSAFMQNGTITAANASKISDGAQGILLMAEDVAKARNITPLARIVAFEEASTAPGDFTIGAIHAAQKCLKKANLTVKDICYNELNEAFSILPILGQKLMGLELDRINVFGGAVALGHPLGYS